MGWARPSQTVSRFSEGSRVVIHYDPILLIRNIKDVTQRGILCIIEGFNVVDAVYYRGDSPISSSLLGVMISNIFIGAINCILIFVISFRIICMRVFYANGLWRGNHYGLQYFY